jgi:RimJ/RimL family protein N-acetyltransferase
VGNIYKGRCGLAGCECVWTEHIAEGTHINEAAGKLVEDRLQGGKGHKPVKLLYGSNDEIAEWVRKQLDMDSGFGPSLAIGVTQGGKIIGGVVYYCYRHPNIEMAVASISPHWANRTTLRAFFDLPFNRLKCKRVTALVDADNKEVQRFDERLGFVKEGVLRQANPNGDAILYGMLKHECRWINGQKERA